MIYFNSTEEAKQYAKSALEKTDYIMLDDVNVKDKDLWAIYRQELRNLYLNPTLESNIMPEPTLNWTNNV